MPPRRSSSWKRTDTILNKVGSEPLSLSHVTSIRPGTPVTETVPAGGGDTEQKVLYTPVYIDVAP